MLGTSLSFRFRPSQALTPCSELRSRHTPFSSFPFSLGSTQEGVVWTGGARVPLADSGNSQVTSAC